MARPIYEIAAEIRKDWMPQGKGVNPAAKPYLGAMLMLDGINDSYGMDTAKGIVTRFICNAGAWRGETAKRVKTELKALAGIK